MHPNDQSPHSRQHHSQGHPLGTSVASFAPSNIALIKYMGKVDSQLNLPANPSISMTLNRLRSFVEVRPAARTLWIPELPAAARAEGGTVPALSDAGISKVIRHGERTLQALPGILAEAGLRAAFSAGEKNLPSFEIRSSNNFPAATGIASSASSFAALTLAVAASFAEDLPAFQKAYHGDPGLRRALANLSRQGSGSSCRSFEGPWVKWEGDKAAAIPSRLPEMTDFVLIVGVQPKVVGSSEAHRRVLSSPLWNGRVERATQRVGDLSSAIERGDLASVAQIAWAEMWEMHSLFHTCAESFSYWEPDTIQVLQWLAPFVRGEVKGVEAPVVTMDAGPNVHLLVPSAQAADWRLKIATGLPGIKYLEDNSGSGAEVRGLL